jgi:hypothetical protein
MVNRMMIVRSVGRSFSPVGARSDFEVLKAVGMPYLYLSRPLELFSGAGLWSWPLEPLRRNRFTVDTNDRYVHHDLVLQVSNNFRNILG